MGQGLFDQYSILHLASGILAYFWGINFVDWFLIHMIFEIVENSLYGITFINKYIKDFWPGGKPRADAIINSISDQFFASIGWLISYYIDYYSTLYGLNQGHFTKIL